MKKKLFYLFVLLAVALIILRAQSVIRYTQDALILCYNIIIPTLFPFFVCSGLLIYSGFGSVLARLSAGFMRPLFNVSPSGSAAFVLGMVSGFPLGAVTTVQLYQCGAVSKSEAERLLSFCNNSGPLFIIGSVGAAIYGKLSYGVLLYCIHIVSAVLVGILFRGYNKTKHTAPPHRLNTADMALSEVFATALANASKNILTVCFSIIFFAALSRTLLDLAPLPPLLDAAASGICEFSTGVLKTSMLDVSLYRKFILTSFIVGFSGISVHIQVMAVTVRSGLSLKPYITGKLLHGCIAAALTAAALYLLPISMSAFSGSRCILSASFAVIPLWFVSVLAVTLLIRMICKKRLHKN